MTWGLTWRALYWTLEKPRGKVQYAILVRIVPNDNRILCLNEIIWKVFSNNFIETQFSIVIRYYPIQDSYWTILLLGPGEHFGKTLFLQTISLKHKCSWKEAEMTLNWDPDYLSFTILWSFLTAFKLNNGWLH